MTIDLVALQFDYVWQTRSELLVRNYVVGVMSALPTRPNVYGFKVNCHFDVDIREKTFQYHIVKLVGLTAVTPGNSAIFNKPFQNYLTEVEPSKGRGIPITNNRMSFGCEY